MGNCWLYKPKDIRNPLEIPGSIIPEKSQPETGIIDIDNLHIDLIMETSLPMNIFAGRKKESEMSIDSPIVKSPIVKKKFFKKRDNFNRIKRKDL